jgi:hypothetical protein
LTLSPSDLAGNRLDAEEAIGVLNIETVPSCYKIKKAKRLCVSPFLYQVR